MLGDFWKWEEHYEAINIFDYEKLAHETLAAMVYDYYASGAYDEITLRNDHKAYDRIQLMYRVLVGVSKEILIDGGVRRETDVLKAIALGAKAVLIGRPVLWGLSADGEEGVLHVLNILRSEIDLAMALCGCSTIADIRRDLVALGGR